MQSSEASPAPNISSPVVDESTYGTTCTLSAASEHSPIMGKQIENDPQLLVGAGRSIKNMLIDLMGVLEPQAKSKIFIQGDITLRIEGREAYTISLFNEDGIEPSNLKVGISKAKIACKSPPDQFNEAGASLRKRTQDEMKLAHDLEDSQKRRRIDSVEDQNASSHPLPGGSKGTSRDDASDSNAAIMTKLDNVSKQIKWVEECRRIADEAHDGREERWRSTSATFHDDLRKGRERHEAWVIQEMAWQRDMLIGLSHDMKGIQSLGHSMKWETPISMQRLPTVPSQSGQPGPFVPYNSKSNKGGGAAGRAGAPGTNIRPK